MSNTSNLIVKERQALGFHLTWGAIRAIGWMFILGVVVASVAAKFLPTDATDLSKDQRSGLTLRTDYGTGCEYLQGSSGQLTPRLDRAGHQICSAS